MWTGPYIHSACIHLFSRDLKPDSDSTLPLGGWLVMFLKLYSQSKANSKPSISLFQKSNFTCQFHVFLDEESNFTSHLHLWLGGAGETMFCCGRWSPDGHRGFLHPRDELHSQGWKLWRRFSPARAAFTLAELRNYNCSGPIHLLLRRMRRMRVQENNYWIG